MKLPFWFRIAKATLQSLISPSLSLHVPATSTSSCEVRRFLYLVLQCCTRSFNQMTSGLFSPPPFSHQHILLWFPLFLCMSTLEDFSSQKGQPWWVTGLWRKGANTLRCACKSKGLTLLLDKWQTDSASALWHVVLTLENLLAKGNQQKDTVIPTKSSQKQGRFNSVSKALH